MYLAALEGAFWVSDTKADTFTPYLNHTDPDIRMTSKRIMSYFDPIKYNVRIWTR